MLEHGHPQNLNTLSRVSEHLYPQGKPLQPHVMPLRIAPPEAGKVPGNSPED